MSKKTKEPTNKADTAKNFVIAVVIVVVLTSMSYTAFITAVGVGGKMNLILSAPCIAAVGGILAVTVFKAVSSFNK